MIIDAHCHIWERDMIPMKYWRAVAAQIGRIVPGTIEQIMATDLMQNNMDGPVDRLIGEMGDAGIDKAIIFGLDWGLYLGEAKIPVDEFNKYIADSAKEYSDKLIPFFTIDPRRPKAPELFEKAITKWEMKGLKLHPTTGYLPDGEESYKLYKIADEYQIPIVTHIGYTMGLKGRTAKLEYFDAPTTDFPNLRLSFAHFNNGDIDELVSLMFMKPSTYCDISAHGQIYMMNSPVDFYRQLRSIMNYAGVSSRVMFGSDWPITNNAVPLARWVKTIQNLTDPKITTILQNLGYRKFKNKEVSQILGKNAEKFLKKV
ncbi:MAG: amidohydrolase [Candidatus Helarchaeota archaeon]|nr:amidohydrolase [Candidatus Helarchaeota archaeon]